MTEEVKIETCILLNLGTKGFKVTTRDNEEINFSSINITIKDGRIYGRSLEGGWRNVIINEVKETSPLN